MKRDDVIYESTKKEDCAVAQSPKILFIFRPLPFKTHFDSIKKPRAAHPY